MPRRNTPIALTVIIALVTTTTLVLGAFGLFNYESERNQQERELRHAVALNADQIAAGLALPVWNFDRPQIDKVIESMMKDEILYGMVVKLADARGTIHARARDAEWRILVVDREFPATGFLVEKRDIVASNEILGTVTLYGATRFMDAQLEKTRALIIARILALDLGLTVMLYLVLWPTVLKPLKEVEAYATAVSSGDGKSLKPPPGAFQGELESLRLAVEKMIGLLDARYAAAQKQLAFDEIIQGLLSRLASSTGVEMDDLIEDTLREMGRYLGVDFAFVSSISPDFTSWSATHEWCAPGIPSRRDKYQNMLIGPHSWSALKLRAGEVVQIESIGDLPPEAAFTRQICVTEGFKSMVQVPLRGRGALLQGSVGLVSLTREITWAEADIQRLKMLGDAIANVLERNRAEDALRRSEARYRTLFESAQDAIFINNGELFVDCNPRALELFGCRRDQIIGQSPARFSPRRQPDGQDSSLQAREHIQAALAGAPQHFEWRHSRLDGAEFEAEVNLNRIDLDHQSHMLGIVRDITQRKAAEAALRESEEKFSTAFRASPDPMTIIEVETGRIVDTNDQFLRFFGWRRHEVIGISTLNLDLWARPEDRKRFMSLLEKHGAVKDFQAVARSRLGELHDCLLSAEVAQINGKKNMIVVSQDITERKRAEEHLQRSSHQLRALSARLQSLREEERIRIAREIHDHLGQLLTALSLDLRLVERRAAGVGDLELRAALNAKIASARTLADETITSVQKIASELRPAILDRVGLEAAIDAEAQAFQIRTGIKCEWHPPAGLTATSADQATAVFRVFQEILTNIARHAQATRVTVRLGQDKGSLLLQVTDDGVGIQLADLQNPKSLGLLGMQERAELLGGQIVFERLPGKGTMVTMRIPVNGKVGLNS